MRTKWSFFLPMAAMMMTSLPGQQLIQTQQATTMELCRQTWSQLRLRCDKPFNSKWLPLSNNSLIPQLLYLTLKTTNLWLWRHSHRSPANQITITIAFLRKKGVLFMSPLLAIKLQMWLLLQWHSLPLRKRLSVLLALKSCNDNFSKQKLLKTQGQNWQQVKGYREDPQ